jgi:hypothetical protein
MAQQDGEQGLRSEKTQDLPQNVRVGRDSESGQITPKRHGLLGF